jgi:NTE family protein
MRIAVLAGGGLKGAFQAGALSEIAEGFDGVVGTSIGAWHALWLAMNNKADFGEAAKSLPSLWTERIHSPKDVYRYYRPKIVSGAWKKSFAHVRPLEKIMNTLIDTEKVRASDVDIWLPAVDLHTGRTVVFDKDTEDLMQAAHASSAYPGVFPPRKIGARTLTDGGIRVTAGVDIALQQGATEIVVIHHARKRFKPANLKSAFGYSMRCIDIMADEVVRNDLSACKAYNRVAVLEDAIDTLPEPQRERLRAALGERWKASFVKLHVIGPKKDIGGALEGDRELIAERVQHGRDMGRLWQHSQETR